MFTCLLGCYVAATMDAMLLPPWMLCCCHHGCYVAATMATTLLLNPNLWEDLAAPVESCAQIISTVPSVALPVLAEAGGGCRKARLGDCPDPTFQRSISGTLPQLSGILLQNSIVIGYATEGTLFLSAQLSTDAVSGLRKIWLLIRLEATEG